MLVKFLILLVVIPFITSNAIAIDINSDSNVAYRLKSKLEVGVGFAKETSMYEFDTPSAHSILTYDKMKNNQYFIDAKFKYFTSQNNEFNNIFLYINGNFGNTMSGEVRDDDVRNGSRVMSYHNLSANNNEQRMGIGYAFDLGKIYPNFNNHIFSLNVGYFKKYISTGSLNGWIAYPDNDVSSYTSSNRDQISRSIFEGVAIGAKIEKIIDKDSSISFALNGLITQYGSSNYWKERDIDWSMRQGGSRKLNGFDAKIEYLTNISNKLDFLIFSYYQEIKSQKLNEYSYDEVDTQPSWVPTEWTNNYAKTQSYGVGFGLKFW